MSADTPIDMLAEWLADSAAGWSMGTFGAIAEFTRDANEMASPDRTDDAASVVTARGGLRLQAYPGLRLIASETPTRESWSHRVALCLPQADCAMNRREVFSEIGPDREALRAQDRDGVLFDLGLATLQVDVCIRSRDAGLTAALRDCTGRPIFAPENAAMRLILAANPHRIFLTRIGRAEVFQPIPPPGGVSPDGPHTHLLPRLLAHGRTHAATEPLPEGWVPCAHLYPPHPLQDQHGRPRSFRDDAHLAFQVLLDRHGDPAMVALKQRVVDAVSAGRPPASLQLPDDRTARAVIRVTLRQLLARGRATDTLSAWIAAWDRPGLSEPDDPMASLH
jgi:hypothetical protein